MPFAARNRRNPYYYSIGSAFFEAPIDKTSPCFLRTARCGRGLAGGWVIQAPHTSCFRIRGGKPDYASFGITPKEAELITCVAEGLGNRGIASKLYLSEGTVRNCISVILEKLGLHTRTQLAVFYYRNMRGA